MPSRSVSTQEKPLAGLVAVDGRRFPLRAAAIRARAEGGLSFTTLRQEYANPYSEPLEVIYTLPLPADGAVVGFTIRIGEKRIVGQIEKREAADERYARALEEGRTAGLLEQERADTFTQRLGSVPPGQSLNLDIEVLHPLRFLPPTSGEEAQWEYRFPTVVGVRYEGAPGRVPDAAQLDVPRADHDGTSVQLGLELVLADGAPEEIAPRSPSHALRWERREAVSCLELAQAARLDRDLIVRWRALRLDVGVRLVEGRGLPGDDGRYALLTLAPPAAPTMAFRRDLTVLIDASGSMMGTPLATATSIARRLLESLDMDDRFEIIAFNDRPQKLTKGLVFAAERDLRDALKKLEALQAGGGTEMLHAMTEALRPLRPDSQRQVVVLTDGYIGFEQEIVGEILAHLPQRARLHMIGVGSAPNRALTASAARAGRGIELMVASEKDVEAEVGRLLQGTAVPVLTDLEVHGAAVRAVRPERPRDVFGAQPVLLALELAPDGGGIEVRGRLSTGEAGWACKLEVPRFDPARPESAAAENAGQTTLPIGALFGREAIADCEMHLAAGSPGDKSQVLARIEALGLRHRIPSRRTSLVAVAEEPGVDPTAPRRRERLPVELPAGVSAEGVGLAGSLHLLNALAPSRMSIDAAFGPLELTGPSMEDTEERLVQRAMRVVPAVLHARLVRVEGDLLVVEFEAPVEGLQLPGDGERVSLHRSGGPSLDAEVVGKQSTRKGLCKSGRTARLALRLAPGATWPRGVKLQFVLATDTASIAIIEVSIG